MHVRILLHHANACQVCSVVLFSFASSATLKTLQHTSKGVSVFNSERTAQVGQGDGIAYKEGPAGICRRESGARKPGYGGW